MPGGLLQLITTGIQDAPIILNPEITFFKYVYKNYTSFALTQYTNYLGSLHFDKEYTKIIEKNGDLLYNLYFKIKIPIFTINKIKNNIITVSTYNINSLDILCNNNYCLVFYYNYQWYIIPFNLFNSLYFDLSNININSILFYNNLLPEYINSLTENNINYYTIKNNKLSNIINITQFNSNIIEQLWINNSLLDLKELIIPKNYYNTIYNLIKYNMFNLYQKYSLTSFTINNKTETERYYEYIYFFNIISNNNDKIQALKEFDIDICYNYCYNNSLNFDDYKNYILYYN